MLFKGWMSKEFQIWLDGGKNAKTEKTSRVFGIHTRAMHVSRQPKVAHLNVPRLTHCHSHIYIDCEKSN